MFVCEYVDSGGMMETSRNVKYSLTNSRIENKIIVTEPDTPLNDADHVGSFNFRGFGDA